MKCNSVSQAKTAEVAQLLHDVLPRIEASLTNSNTLTQLWESDDFLRTLTKIRSGLSILRSFENTVTRQRLLTTVLDSLAATLDNASPRTECPEPPVASCAMNEGQAEEDKRDEGDNGIDPVAQVRPSRNNRWCDVIGAKRAVAALKQAVILPQKMPHLFSGARKPWSCILLYGPPGTGKTMLAAAAAVESGAPFLSVSASDLLSKWVGESEKLIRQLFADAARHPRCIVFLDEIDALCGSRGAAQESESSRRMKTEFLVRLQTVDPLRVTVIAATNLPWELDIAFRRRFDKVIFVDLPDADERKLLLINQFASNAHALRDEDFVALADALHGYTPCDMVHIVRAAVMAPICRLQEAEYFRLVCSSPLSTTELLEPCTAQDSGSFPATLTDVDSSLIAPLIVRVEDVREAIQTFPRSVTQEYMAQYAAWEATLRLR